MPVLALTLALGLIVATMAGGCPGDDDDDDDTTPGDDDDTTPGDDDSAGDDDTAPVDADGDGYDTTDDCDDSNADIHPGADEGCDGVDTDCDGALGSDEIDDDGDGFNECIDGDCDDFDAAVYPGATEYCNGHDDDCDGEIDEADAVDPVTWYEDADGDGHGHPGVTAMACDVPEGFAADSDDCDDTEATVYPGAPELCDGLDNDCDPSTDELVDDDGDGYAECDGDCDDTTILAFPGNPEVCRDHLDNDCDGTGNQCDLVGDISLADADAILVGEHAYDGAGSALAACDLNGDGLDDLIVGAAAHVIPAGLGAAYAVTAPFSGVMSLADADAKLIGIDQYDGIGDSVTCGDVNGDGIGDLLASGMNTFGAYVLFGPVDGVGTVSIDEADAEMYGSTGYGIGVESGFDNNHDGIVDVLLLDSFANNGGMAYLVQGPIVGEVTGYEARFDGPGNKNDILGSAMPVGDQDGDGNVDYLFFGSIPDGTGDRGWLLLGPLSGTVNETDAVATFEYLFADPDPRPGWTTSAPGDYDGDGLDDLLFLDPSYDSYRGAALGFFGVPGSLSGPGITGGSADVIFEGEQYDNGFPSLMTMTFSGDVDGDGREDIIGGYNGGDVGGDRTGTVYLVTDHPTGTQQLANSAARFIGEAEVDLAGYAIEAGGDVDGDGFSDIWITSLSDRGGEQAGAVYLILGNGK